MSTVPTDQIYERYLQKAITEINELGDEIARAGDTVHVPVLGSGHPLADVFLLKHEPKPAEVHEGVAFYGRAGQALLKSLQRLGVDPLAVYGTNCLNFVMGPAAVGFVNELGFPLSDKLDPDAEGRQQFTPTIEALVVPDIDASLDEAPAKTAFWNAFKALGPWWAELPPY